LVQRLFSQNLFSLFATDIVIPFGYIKNYQQIKENIGVYFIYVFFSQKEKTI